MHQTRPVVPYLLRPVMIALMLVIGLEWFQSLVVLAEPNGASVANVDSTELPPIQEVQTTEVRSPFYKRWWFWTIVAAVLGGAAIAVAAGSSGGGGSPPPSGTVTVNGPAPR